MIDKRIINSYIKCISDIHYSHHEDLTISIN